MPSKLLVRHVGDRLSSPNGTSVPMTAAAWSTPSPSMAGDRSGRRAAPSRSPAPRSCSAASAGGSAPRSPTSTLVSTSVRDALLQEERRPLRALDESGLQRLNRRVVAEEAVEELVRAGRGQRVDPQLPIVRLRAPGVLVLGTIVDEQQDARGRGGSPPARPPAPASRRRSSASPRTPRRRAGPGSREGAAASRRRGSAGAAARGRGAPTADRPSATSSSHRNAAMNGSRARSSDRSRPVTFSRMIRASSRPSIRK